MADELPPARSGLAGRVALAASEAAPGLRLEQSFPAKTICETASGGIGLIINTAQIAGKMIALERNTGPMQLTEFQREAMSIAT